MSRAEIHLTFDRIVFSQVLGNVHKHIWLGGTTTLVKGIQHV